MTHHCPYPAAGCTDPVCPITAARHDDRIIETLVRVENDHTVHAMLAGDVTCPANPDWHPWPEHRRHVAIAQIIALRNLALLPAASLVVTYGGVVHMPGCTALGKGITWAWEGRNALGGDVACDTCLPHGLPEQERWVPTPDEAQHLRALVTENERPNTA